MRRFDERAPGRIKQFSGTAKAYRRALPFIKKAFFVRSRKGCFCGEKTAIVCRIHASFEDVMRRRFARLRKGLTRLFLFLQTAATAQPFPFGRKKPHAFLKYSVDKCAEK